MVETDQLAAQRSSATIALPKKGALSYLDANLNAFCCIRLEYVSSLRWVGEGGFGDLDITSCAIRREQPSAKIWQTKPPNKRRLVGAFMKLPEMG